METAIGAFFAAAAIYIVIALALSLAVIFFVVRFIRRASRSSGFGASRSSRRGGSLFDDLDDFTDRPTFSSGRSGRGGFFDSDGGGSGDSGGDGGGD